MNILGDKIRNHTICIMNEIKNHTTREMNQNWKELANRQSKASVTSAINWDTGSRIVRIAKRQEITMGRLRSLGQRLSKEQAIQEDSSVNRRTRKRNGLRRSDE